MNRKGTIYEIRVSPPLDQDWQDWFDGLSITRERENIAVITGRVADQAALHGLLNRIQELALKLIALRQIPDMDQGDASAEE